MVCENFHIFPVNSAKFPAAKFIAVELSPHELPGPAVTRLKDATSLFTWAIGSKLLKLCLVSVGLLEVVGWLETIELVYAMRWLQFLMTQRVSRGQLPPNRGPLPYTSLSLDHPPVSYLCPACDRCRNPCEAGQNSKITCGLAQTIVVFVSGQRTGTS